MVVVATAAGDAVAAASPLLAAAPRFLPDLEVALGLADVAEALALEREDEEVEVEVEEEEGEAAVEEECRACCCCWCDCCCCCDVCW